MNDHYDYKSPACKGVAQEYTGETFFTTWVAWRSFARTFVPGPGALRLGKAATCVWPGHPGWIRADGENRNNGAPEKTLKSIVVQC